MPIEQIRTALFIALCVVMFMMWQAWKGDHTPLSQQSAPAVSTSTATQHAPVASSTSPKSPTAATGTDVPQAPSQSTKQPAPATASKRAVGPAPGSVQVNTDTIHAVISLAGGTLTKLSLPKYPVSTDKPKVPFQLLNDTGVDFFEAQSGLLGEAGAPNHHALFTAASKHYRLAPGSDSLKVVLTAATTGSVTYHKVFTFHRDSYVVDVAYVIDNKGTQPWHGRMYAQFERVAPPSHHGLFHTYTYTGGVLSRKEKPYEKVSFKDMKKKALSRKVTGGWVAMIQHYFAGAWIPSAQGHNLYYTKSLGDERFVIGVVGPERDVAPGGNARVHMRAYLGPKVEKRMQKVAPNLERTVDYGWLFFIAEPLFWLLQHIHGIVGNWGVAIILLTMLIKLAFFQLSATSYKSMARMRKLQPRLQHLKERYGDDRQKLNKAMMEMYKTEKINPLGGCLPIAVQVPVFISLYWMLLESVALRQAPFFFWIHDLSLPDPYFVLPVLMGVTMLAQQRLNPAPADPLQAKVMMALPFVFTVFFLWFPSGLVLYWLVNNILSVAQQWVITKRITGKI